MGKSVLIEHWCRARARGRADISTGRIAENEEPNAGLVRALRALDAEPARPDGDRELDHTRSTVGLDGLRDSIEDVLALSSIRPVVLAVTDGDITRQLLASDSVVSVDGRLEFSVPQERLTILFSKHHTLEPSQAELGKLDPEQRAALDRIALLGDGRPMTEIAAVAGLEVESLNELLETTGRASILGTDGRHCYFGHPRLIRLLNGALTLPVKQAHHRAIAEALRHLYPDALHHAAESWDMG